MNGRELDMKERWIHEGWFHQEGELLLHIRDRQDERQLLGGKSRVLQDWEESEQRRSVLVIPANVDIRSRRLLEDVFC